MSVWGRLTYGDPCRECGFQLPLTLDDAVFIVGSTPDDVAVALAGRDPASHHPDLTWSALAYVCHITDNLRIWAERLVGAGLGSTRPVSPYRLKASTERRLHHPTVILGTTAGRPGQLPHRALEAVCMIRARRLGASPSDIGEALGITRQAVYNRLHSLEHRADTNLDLVAPDLAETEKIPDLDTPAPRTSDGAVA